MSGDYIDGTVEKHTNGKCIIPRGTPIRMLINTVEGPQSIASTAADDWSFDVWASFSIKGSEPWTITYSPLKEYRWGCRLTIWMQRFVGDGYVGIRVATSNYIISE